MNLPQYQTIEEKNSYFETRPEIVGNTCVIDTEDEFDEMVSFLSHRKQDIDNRRAQIKGKIASSNLFKNKEEEQKWIILHGLEEGLLFRGVSEAKYKILSSAQRYWLEHDLEEGGMDFVQFVDGLLSQIRTNELLKEYYSSLRVPINDLLYLGLLQHYGECSPLIDVSYDMNVSLFFALNYTKRKWYKCGIDDYCSLYVIDTFGNQYWGYLDSILNSAQENEAEILANPHIPVELIDTSNIDSADLYTKWTNFHNNGGGLHDFNLALIKLPTAKGAIALRTRIGQNICWTNLNLLAQKGGFIMYNDTKQSLEEYVCEHQELPRIVCYNINKKLKDYILNEINHTEEDIYPQMKDIVTHEINIFKDRKN